MRLLNDDQTKIVEKLKTEKVLSVDDLTRTLKKTKTAVRRALLHLEKREIVERLWKKGTRGRPCLAFQLSINSKSLFPTKEAEVLNELIGFLSKSGQTTLLEEFFQKYWDIRYKRVLAKLSKYKCRDLSTRLTALKEVLAEDGFYPRSNISKKNDQVTLRECHCPISAVASVTDLPCRLEAELIAKVLNAAQVQVEPMSPRQSDCRFIVARKGK